MRRALVLALTLFGLLCLRVGNADAATCTLPYILQNGTIPNAAQVMADFYALLNCINTGGGGGGGGGGQVFTCSNTPGICPFSIPMFWPGIPPANQVVRISLTDTVTCPANLPNSEGAAKTAATGSPVVNIYQVVSGTPTLRATATFSGGTPTFAAASVINFAVGDVVQYQFPGSPDATMADVSLTLHCNRTSGSAVGSSGAPLPNGDIWVGNPTGLAQAQTPTGDVSMTNAGVFSVLKINGTSVPASPTAGQTILATSGVAATWGLVPNASLVNSSTTVNGQNCVLGATCTISSAATSVTVGTTTISSGTSGRVLYDNAGVLGELATTGSGNVTLATAPTVSALIVTGSLTATGLVTNADLVNQSTTVNGQTCTLGSTCTVSAAATSITVGTTTIASGTNGDIEFNNSGVLGEKAVTGTGSVVLATSPSVSGLTVTGSFTATGLVTNADLANASTTVAGQTCTLGSSCSIAIGNLSNIAANTYVGNPTSGSAAPAATAISGCSGNNHASQYTTNTGFTCVTNVADLDVADQTISGGFNVTSDNLGTVSSGTTTIDCGARPLQYLTNGGAFTLAAPANDGSCLVLSTNNASAGAITFSGFSVGSSTGDALDTTNTHKFTISVWRINGTSGYRVAAHQ